MLTETKLTAKLVEAWSEMGADVLNIHGNQFQASGWPDVFVDHRVWSGFIEFKGPKTAHKPHQKRLLRNLGVRNNAWLVTFVFVEGKIWQFNITDCNLVNSYEFAAMGTNGQVAASLLKELARLDDF